MKKNCGNCVCAKPNGRDGAYCRMFGIMIYKEHDGCRYHKGKEDVGNDTANRDGVDDSPAKAAG